MLTLNVHASKFFSPDNKLTTNIQPNLHRALSQNVGLKYALAASTDQYYIIINHSAETD